MEDVVTADYPSLFLVHYKCDYLHDHVVLKLNQVNIVEMSSSIDQRFLIKSIRLKKLTKGQGSYN